MKENKDKLPNTQVIRIILNHILKHSSFRFIDKHFLQINGTSMGGRYAPPYANLFMGRIENRIHQVWGNNIIFWKRFIDDIFFIFKGDINQLIQLQNFMNDIHDTIKFTFEQSRTDIDFLDTHLSLSHNTITTSLFKKPTDRSLLLHYNSNHPENTKKSIIYSQAIRYNTIIQDDNTLQTELYNLTKTLLARRYPLKLINNNITKALTKSREELLQTTEKPTKTNILPIIIHHNKSNEKTKRQILQHWNIMQNDNDLNKIIPIRPTMAYKRSKTIGNTLVRSDTT